MRQSVAYFLAFVLSLSTVFGQTLTHPEKVYINPPGTGGTDSLKIDGGLKAGNAGAVQVINADGTISVSATIGDGTIQKVKFGNDCTNGQIIVRNSSGTPPYWDCGTASSAGGIQASDNNITITGTGWRFQNSTVFGSSVTAQELVHIYNSAGIAGIALQNNAQDWRIRATNNDLQVSNGTNYPLTIKTNQIGIFDTVPETGWEVDLTGDLRISGNIGNLGSFTNHVYPSTTDTLDLGIYNTKWRSLYVGSVVMDQFVTQNVLLYDGYHIIGKSSGELNAAIITSDTSFVADESHSIGDYLVIRGRDSGGGLSTEYMAITNKSGAGPYTYSVTRNLDGSGANNWAIDTPYLILGKQYDGRIEMFTNAGIPTIRVIVQGSAWNTFDSLVHMGGLDGITGVDAARYGLYVGKQDGTGNYLKFQNSLASPTGDDGKLLIKGGIVAGSYVVSNSTVEVNAQGLTVGNTGSIRGGKDTYGDALAGFWMGYDSTLYKFYIGNNTQYVRWTGASLDVRGTLNASDINAGTMSVSYLQTNALTAAYLAADSVEASEIAANAVTASEIAADAVTADEIAANSVTSSEFNATSALYIGLSKTWDTLGIQLEYNSGSPRFRVGDAGASANYMKYESGALTISGSITGSTITGGTVQTAASGARIVLDTTPALKWYNSSAQLGSITSSGISLILGAAASASTSGYTWVDSSNSMGLYGYTTADPAKVLTLENEDFSGTSSRNIRIASGNTAQGTYIHLFTTGATSGAALMSGSTSSGLISGTDATLTLTNSTDIVSVYATGGFELDTNSNSVGMRIRGLAQDYEIADIYVGANNELVITTRNQTDLTSAAAAYIDVDPEDDQYGLVLRDAGTGTSSYANFVVVDDTVDYMAIRINSSYSTAAGLFIDDDDQVGVGTATPSALLHVQGSATYTTENGPLMVTDSTTTTKKVSIGYDATNDFGFISALNSGVQWRPLVLQGGGGNVGIGTGTTAPATALDIDSHSNGSALRIRGNTATTEIADIYVDSTGALVLSTVAGSDTDAYINVVPDDDQYGLILRESGDAGGSYVNSVVVDTTVDYLAIRVNAPYSSTDGLFVTDDDRVGIGTSTPGDRLTVAGRTRVYTSGDDEGYVAYDAVTSGTHIFSLTRQSNDGVLATYSGLAFDVAATGGLPSCTAGGTTPCDAWFDSSAADFHVNGIEIRNWTTIGTGHLDVRTCGAVSSGDAYLCYDSSSVRYKENIVDLGTIDPFSLRPVVFTRKGQPSGVREFGFIAEEIAQVPSLWPLVTHIDGRIEGVDYSRVTVVLTAIVQQQQRTIDELQKRVKALEKRVK